MSEGVTCRIVTCGEPSVGKTALLKRITSNRFNVNEPPTVGSDYYHYDADVDGQHIEIQIWDTAGEERFRSVVPLYFRNSAGAVLVFDQTRKETFERLTDWVRLYKETTGDSALFFVAANKSDLVKGASGSEFFEEVYSWASGEGYPVYQTSAKTGEGVRLMVDDIIHKMSEVTKATAFQTKGNRSKVELAGGANREKKTCC